MKSIIKYVLISLIIILNSCFNTDDIVRFSDNIGTGSINDIEISLNAGTIEIINDTIVSNVQCPNVKIKMSSHSSEPITLTFKFMNMSNDGIPIIVPNIGIVEKGKENKTIYYNIELQPFDEFSVELICFPDSERYSFAVVGDIQGNKEAADKISRSIANQNKIDFLIVLGDLVTNGDPDEYEWAYKFVNDCPIPVYIVIGNHDIISSSGGYNLFCKYFGKTNYEFVYNNDLFLFLDAADIGISKEVYDFAANSLGSHNCQNKFIFQHVPVFEESGTRNHSYNTNYDAARFMNLLIKMKVDIVFAGHVHSYQDFTISGVRNIVVGTGGGNPEKFDGHENGYIIVSRDVSKIQITKIAV